MYLGSWKIDDYLTIPCNTHTPSTGAATDADSVPTYRIYEDDNGTAIDSGNTAKLDDANTTGFYVIKVQLLEVTGYAKGQTYTVYLSATVGGVTGTMSHTFQIEAEVDSNTVSSKTGYSLAADQSAVTIGTCTTNTDMRGTDNAALAATALTNATWTDAKAGYLTAAVATATALATAQADLDTLTGTDGATLATSQPNYAPATAAALSTMQGNVTDILADTNELQGDWVNTGRLDTILDSILTDTGTTIPGTITTMQGNVTDILADTNELQGDWTNTGRLDTIIDAIKAKTDNLPDGIKKNTAFSNYTILLVDSTDHVTAKTGLTVSGSYSGDGGAVASLTNSVSEISNGLYKVNLTAGELNYDTVTLIFTASGADARVITHHPST